MLSRQLTGRPGSVRPMSPANISLDGISESLPNPPNPANPAGIRIDEPVTPSPSVEIRDLRDPIPKSICEDNIVDSDKDNRCLLDPITEKCLENNVIVNEHCTGNNPYNMCYNEDTYNKLTEYIRDENGNVYKKDPHRRVKFIPVRITNIYSIKTLVQRLLEFAKKDDAN